MQRVEWSYWHSLNSKSRVLRTKRGTLLKIYDGKYGQMAVVKFDGNKNVSRVRFARVKEV